MGAALAAQPVPGTERSIDERLRLFEAEMVKSTASLVAGPPFCSPAGAVALASFHERHLTTRRKEAYARFMFTSTNESLHSSFHRLGLARAPSSKATCTIYGIWVSVFACRWNLLRIGQMYAMASGGTLLNLTGPLPCDVHNIRSLSDARQSVNAFARAYFGNDFVLDTFLRKSM